MKTEFRIGNLAKSRHFAEPVMIQEIRTDHYWIHRIGYDESVLSSELHPIPLTEDLLMDFGFEAKGDDGEWYHPSEELFELHHNYLAQDGFTHIWDGAYTEAKVEFVHQLQNLFFSLCGKELSITKKLAKK